MKQNLITDVIQGMLPYLNNAQTERLQEVLQHTLFDYEITKAEKDKKLSEQNLVESFLSAKRIEGCSEKTLKYYNATIQSMLDGIGKGINPESRLTSSQYSSSMISGYQRGGFPLTSTISAGFDINF